MMSLFATVVEYHHYCLVYITPVPAQAELGYVYKYKDQIDGLHCTLSVFSGFHPIELMYFLATMVAGLEATEK